MGHAALEAPLGNLVGYFHYFVPKLGPYVQFIVGGKTLVAVADVRAKERVNRSKERIPVPGMGSSKTDREWWTSGLPGSNGRLLCTCGGVLSLYNSQPPLPAYACGLQQRKPAMIVSPE